MKNFPLLALAGAVAASPASAGEIFGGAYVHDVQTPITRSGQEGGIDLMLGWRGDRIEALRAVGAPSPHVYAQVNTSGDTSFLGAGISWKIGRTLYVRPGIGVAVHDGPRGPGTPPDRIDFGSRVVFVPEISAGYQIDSAWSVEASWVHYSHAQLLSRNNPGSDNFGVRLNYRFR
ncbi:MAG: acyloxyacyl hydrolase [Allosphingosinicella sp.]|uniref:acyloxyacyl hydrolase n=1 Tax=Allosphingosinicella sp. TaxID=2823234 RepID=UPI00394F3724